MDPQLISSLMGNPAFSMQELTEAFNEIPNNFGTLTNLGLFEDMPLRGPVAWIEVGTQSLNLLPEVPRGGPPSQGTIGTRRVVPIQVPHFPHEDSVLAGDVAGVRAFGTASRLQGVQELMAEKLYTMGQKHRITREFMNWGAVNGRVYNSAGTMLLDLFTTFDKTEKVISLDLNNASAEVLVNILALKTYMDLNSEGAQVKDVVVYTGESLFNALITHPSVKTAYQYYVSSQEVLRNDLRAGFSHGGVSFIQENGYADTADGTRYQFVNSSEGRAIPRGTNAFKTALAPADFLETVNTKGLPRYAKQHVMKYERGIEIWTESNVLPICMRPQLLVRITK